MWCEKDCCFVRWFAPNFRCGFFYSFCVSCILAIDWNLFNYVEMIYRNLNAKYVQCLSSDRSDSCRVHETAAWFFHTVAAERRQFHAFVIFFLLFFFLKNIAIRSNVSMTSTLWSVSMMLLLRSLLKDPIFTIHIFFLLLHEHCEL